MMSTTLTQYVAKRRRRTKAVRLPVLLTIPVDVRHGHRSRVRDIYHIFAAVQKRDGKWILPLERDQRMHTCFAKLAVQVETLEVDGPPVDIVLYVQAHKAVYGKDLRPHHLIGRFSLDIYAAAQTARAAQEVTLTSDQQQAYDEELLAQLSAQRGESIEEVRRLLEHCAVV